MNNMQYRKIGKTDLESSVIGFGCWQLGGELNIAGIPQSYGKIDETEARKAIHLAIDKGINFFDTADLYGLGKSEYILGEELANKRDKVILCTKGGYVPDGLKGTIFDASFEHIISACNRSLKRLKTDYIDIYLLHFIPEKELIQESVEALVHLKEQGKIKQYGVSVAHNIKLIPDLSKYFDIFEGYYNILFNEFENLEEVIKNNKLGFIAASPLSRGLLTGKNYDSNKFENGDVRKKWELGQAQHEWYVKQNEKISKLKLLSEEWNIPLKNIAILYILSNNISLTIPGLKSEDQVLDLIKSLDYPLLNREQINTIKSL